MQPNEINHDMIRKHINFTKNEYGTDISESTAKSELESLKSKGCLLYDDCRSCPKFGKCNV